MNTVALPTEVEALQALVGELRERNAELEQRLAWYSEQYRLAQHRRFAASSERAAQQLDLFSELLESSPALEEAPLPKPSHAGANTADARRRGKRGPLPLNLPREEVIHDLR